MIFVMGFILAVMLNSAPVFLFLVYSNDKSGIWAIIFCSALAYTLAYFLFLRLPAILRLVAAVLVPPICVGVACYQYSLWDVSMHPMVYTDGPQFADAGAFMVALLCFPSVLVGILSSRYFQKHGRITTRCR